jgi:membrane protease YdiL (CAAX protease family)
VNEDDPAPAEPEDAPEAPPATSARIGWIRLAGGFYGIVTLFAFGYAIFAGSGGEPFLGLALPSLSLVLAGVGVGLVVVGVVHVGLRLFDAVTDGAREMARILGPLTRKEAIYLALFSSVGEELLFRGALWPHLGLIGTTCLFGLSHILPRKALWGYPLFAAAVGLIFGLLRMAGPEDGGSVIPCIVAHFVINALNLAWLGAHHDRLLAVNAGAGAASHDPDA